MRKVSVCIVTTPLNRAGLTPLSNFVKLLSKLADEVFVVSGGAAEDLKFDTAIQIRVVDRKVSSKVLIRIINFVITQLEILRHVIAISRRVDLFVFSLGGEGMFVSVLPLKLLRKKVILVPGGVTTKVYSVKKDSFSRPVSVLVNLALSLANILILYSRKLVQEGTFARYQHKTIIAHRHFVDFTKFVVKKKINERANVVGYIGRFSEEKGILNLVQSIPIMLKHRKDVRFILYGDGKLYDEIKKIIQYEKVEPYVKLGGWVSHEGVPNILNDIKLLVLPSYTEGLPNIMLEAMACGTPVLATPVGAIPDIIKDCENGFLLESNDPKHIAERIIELFNKPELLEKVSVNTYNYVRENFNYEKTIESWRKIFNELGLL